MTCKKWLLAFILAVLTTSSAYAVDPADKVELDGNVVRDDNAFDDWQNINLGTHNADVATGLITDLPPATIFWKGGSKDTQDVTKWWYKDGSVPDKDDLRNGYAAAYFLTPSAGDDELVIYFGAERYANTGDAIMGFWFFQDTVGPGPNNRFTGQHTENDLFVIMEYPQGSNSEPFVQVMRWVNSGGNIDEHLDLLYSSGDAGAKCMTATDTGIACAKTNDDNELAGVAHGLWAYESKSGPVNMYPPESFFEGRVNVSQAFAERLPPGFDLPCFSSFLIETRSSRSETAQLKDFLGGDFPLCSIAVTKTCGMIELTEDDQFLIEYAIMLENTGVGSITGNKVITIDDMPSNPSASGPATFTLSGAIDGFGDNVGDWGRGDIITVEGTYKSAVNGGSNTVDAKVNIGSVSAPTFITATQFTATCLAPALSPALSIVKNCTLSLEDQGDYVAVRKDYDVYVCNTGNVPLDVILTDVPDSTLNKTFPLDFPRQCIDDFGCSAGYQCKPNTVNGLPALVCENTAGDLEGNFGDAVCELTERDYLPDTAPTTDIQSLTNTATAKATSPVVDTGVLATTGNSAGDTCALCPDDGL